MGTLSPNPWDLPLSRQNGCSLWGGWRRPAIPAAVSECAQRRQREAGRIEPARACPLVSWQIAVADAARALVRRIRQGAVAALGHREWKTRLGLIDRRRLPAAYDLGSNSLGPGGKALTGAKRKLIYRRKREAVANIIVGGAPLRAEVVVILRADSPPTFLKRFETF